MSNLHVSTNVEDLPFLPLSTSVESTLKEQTKFFEGEKVSYILTYEGSKSYTVFQSLIDKSKAKDYESITVNGDMVSTVYGIGFMDGNKVKYIYNDVSYEIYSKDLSVSEMINTVKSMESASQK